MLNIDTCSAVSPFVSISKPAPPTSKNWGQILREIQQIQQDAKLAGEKATNDARLKSENAINEVRINCLNALYNYTNRNVISYYSGFLSKRAESGINDEDKNGFMMAVHKLDRKKGLDLILHTEGGRIAATQSLVDYLHKMFGNNIRAIIPQIAMSGGTMLACSCKEIWMAKHSNLGPIDPQVSGIPCQGVKIEFEKAYQEIVNNPARLKVWTPILQQYGPTFLGECDNAVKWSNTFVKKQLASVMFAGISGAKRKAETIVKKLSSYKGNMSHERHIHFDECKAIGLEVKLIEDVPEFQDLVLPVHHCYMHMLMNTNVFKMIENHAGVAFIKALRQS